MASINPILDAMGTLAEADIREKRAMLDLQEAQMKKRMAGQTAVPGVAAELAKMEQKRQQQREKIAKQQATQGPSQQAFVPQVVEPTGIPQARTSQAAIQGASELLDRTLGGGGLRRAGMVPDPSAGPTQTIQQTVGMGQQSGAPGQQPVQPQVPGAVTQMPPSGQAVPGQLVPQSIQLSGLEQYLGGAAQMLLGIRGGSGGAFVSGLHDLATGERTVGFEQLPTVETMGKKLSQRIYGAQQGLTGASAALNDEITAVANRYGKDVARQVMTAGLADASALEYEQQQSLNDPKARIADQRWRILEKIEVGEPLSPGQKLIANSILGEGKTTVNIENRIMQPSTRASMEQVVEDNRDFIAQLNHIDRVFYDAYFTYFKDTGRTPTAIRSFYAQLGADVSEEGKEKLRKFAALDQALGLPGLVEAHKLVGAYMSPMELTRYDRAFKAFSEATDATTARQSLDDLREMTGLAIIRKVHALSLDPDAPPSAWIELGDGRDLAIEDTAAYAKTLVEKYEMSFDDAMRESFDRMENIYGLKVRGWPEFQRRPQ